MAEISFVEVRKTIQYAAAEHGVRLSVQKSKRLAQQFLWASTIEEYDRLHSDPTGEEAVRRVMEWVSKQQLETV